MKRLFERLVMNRSLRFKMISIFSVLFLLMMSVVSVITNGLVRQSSEEQARYAASQAFTQAEAILRRKVENVMFASDVLMNLDALYTALEKSARGNAPDMGDEYRAMLESMKTMTVLQTQDICNVRIYAAGAFTYADEGYHFAHMDDLPPSVVARAKSGGKGMVWLPPQTLALSSSQSVRAVSMLRLIRSGDDYREITGAQCISMDADALDELLVHGSAVEGGYLYLTNQQGELIAASRDMDGCALLPDGMQPDWDTVDVNGAEYIAYTAAIGQTDWRLASMLPASALSAAGVGIVRTLIGWMLGVAAVTIVLIGLVCHSLTGRIRQLDKEMERVREGQTNAYVEARYDDEIGHLCNSFNYMISEINALALQQYENGKAIKQSELKALQAQINPHFLYNTLDLINWEALDLGAQRIAKITQAMARFYRLSLGRGKDFVHIQDELNHVATYVEIQNFRFDNKIRLSTEVEGELGYASMLKLVLQPLVENCILHGILGDEGKDGRILITVRSRGDDIVIDVRDFGSGMSPEQLERIMQPPEDESGVQGGYGVYNIHRRIRLCYGEPYGLCFTSVLHEGTTAEVLIPDTRTQARRRAE